MFHSSCAHQFKAARKLAPQTLLGFRLIQFVRSALSNSNLIHWATRCEFNHKFQIKQALPISLFRFCRLAALSAGVSAGTRKSSEFIDNGFNACMHADAAALF